jgi:GNAT superfamily N-acetyltransferase
MKHRLASEDDLPALREVMRAAIERSLPSVLSADQVTASHAIMGLDSQLVRDHTYFAIDDGSRIAGCGGWSRRATLYGGDHSQELREPRFLDPKSEPARVRAMYTSPDYQRRGIGRRILQLCEQAAAAEGYRQLELVATLSGESLYRAYGFEEVERLSTEVDGVSVPLLRMRMDLGFR